jgi:hypothetical protein
MLQNLQYTQGSLLLVLDFEHRDSRLPSQRKAPLMRRSAQSCEASFAAFGFSWLQVASSTHPLQGLQTLSEEFSASSSNDG